MQLDAQKADGDDEGDKPILKVNCLDNVRKIF